MTGFLHFYGWIIFHYVYNHNFFTHSSINGHSHCFHVLDIVNNAAMNIGVQISFWISVFNYFAYIPRIGVAESYGSSIFNCLRRLPTILHNSCTNLQSHQQCINVLFPPHPHQHLLSLVVLIMVILTRIRWYLIVILIFIS